MYYSTRHEKHVVTEIIQEANSSLDDEDRSKALYLYHALVNQFVFLAVKRGGDTEGQTTNITINKAVRALSYSPAWVLMLVIILDILPLFFAMDVVIGRKQALWPTLDIWGRTEVVMRLMFCGILHCSLFLFVERATCTNLT